VTLGSKAERLEAITTLPALMAEFFRREPVFTGAAALLAVAILPTLLAIACDRRMLLGVNIWIKPLKFELSLAVYLATLAWFAGWLPDAFVEHPSYKLFAWAVAAAAMIEMIWVAGAAAFGVASHYNRTQPLLAAIYPLMGLIAVFLTSATLVYGIVILSDATSPLDPTFRLSVGLGLVLTFVSTVIVAGYMASHSRTIGVSPSDAHGLSLLGWSREVGDLRVAHFFATHAMHFIPLFGLLTASMLQTRIAVLSVAAFSALYSALVAYTFVSALGGKPFLS
jgi:hypothetical protein